MTPKFAPAFVAGWPCLPLAKDGKKTPLVSGYHGEDRKRATKDEVKAWSREFPDANPGIVMPDNVIGLDVDGPSHGVNGTEAIEAFEEKFGPLPETGHIYHGRTDDGSPSPYGTYLYRIPDEMLDVYTRGSVVGNLTKVTGKAGVDVIAPWLRYNVAPGAVHASGETYEFTPGGRLPKPEELPALTKRQVEGLLKRKATSKPLVGAERPRTRQEEGAGLLAQVRALAALEDGQRLLIKGEMRGWQQGNGFFVLACDLVRLAKNRAKVKRQFIEAAGDYPDAERQWENAEASVDEEFEEAEAAAYSCAALIDPYNFVAEYLARHYTQDGVLTLRYTDSTYWLWCGTHFRPLMPEEVQARLARELNGALETNADGEVRPLRIKRQTKAELLSSLQDRTLVSPHGAGALLPATRGVPFRNGWLDVETGAIEPLSPERDIRWVVPADYDPKAECPEWLHFLKSIGFTEDTEEYRLLRQWFGYVLSGDTSHQKALIMVGPSRAGKGTILDVQEAMMGDGHVGIDLSAFSTNFGLAPVIGKGLATIGDVRFDMKTDKAMVRRMLSLTGEDTISIDRKYKDAVSVKVRARLAIASNEVPSILEASDALASRFLFLTFKESFRGREDRGIKKRVLAEIPGIVRWALAGLDDLIEEGKFTETARGVEMQREMTEIANPIVMFIEEECVMDPNAFTLTDDLHNEYAIWAEHRRFYVPSAAIFGRDLNAAFPDSVLRRTQRRQRNGKLARGFLGVKLAR